MVVVSPHPDDETYAMGQTMAAQAKAGHRVVGVLVTDGETSAYAATWTAEAGRDMDRDGDIDKWDFGLARRGEYFEAMRVLGVRQGGLYFLGQSASQGEVGFGDGDIDVGDLTDALDEIARQEQPAGLFTLMPYRDASFGRIAGDARAHPDHTAGYEAVRRIAAERAIPAWFFKVYVGYQDPWKRLATVYVRGDDGERAAKSAMAAEYAIGATSTPELWEYARSGEPEYLGETYSP